jgi:hypothetical protein
LFFNFDEKIIKNIPSIYTETQVKSSFKKKSQILNYLKSRAYFISLERTPGTREQLSIKFKILPEFKIKAVINK